MVCTTDFKQTYLYGLEGGGRGWFNEGPGMKGPERRCGQACILYNLFNAD